MPSQGNHTKLSRLAKQVRSALDKRYELTYKDLEQVTGYEVRRIRDAIKELIAHEVPVQVEGWPKRFSLPQELRRQNRCTVDLNEEEILALRLATQIARSVLAPTPILPDLDSAFERLLAEMNDQTISIDRSTQKSQWHFSDAPSAPIHKEVFKQLRRAIQLGQSIVIDYYSASSERSTKDRKLNPYCIAGSSGSWILVAWCHQAQDEREFNLVDIQRVRLSDPNKDPEAFFEQEQAFNPDLYFRDRFRYISEKEAHFVRLLVEPKQARYFMRKHYHPTQQIEEEREDGRIVVSYDVEGLDELRSFAQSWGTGVTVLEPEELRTIMREQAAIVLQRYEETTPTTDTHYEITLW